MRGSELRYTVTVDDIEASLVMLGGEAPVHRLQTHVLAERCGGEVPSNYKSERTYRQTVQRIIENYCPQAVGSHRRRGAKFLRTAPGVYRLAGPAAPAAIALAEEISSPALYVEGATTTIAINSYERSAAARIACIAHYGCSCIVCSFDFAERYGAIGTNFIHVHHLVPLSEIGTNYVVDPIADLRPVCPNCHAMLHSRKEQYGIEELRSMILAQAEGR